MTLDSTDPVLSVLTPDFLHYNEIVPVHWELEKPVFVSPDFTKMVFDSGITVQVEEGRVEFASSIDDWPNAEMEIFNDVVRRFLGVLPGLDLTGFSTGIEGYSPMPEGCPGIVNIGNPLDGQIPVIGHRSKFYFPDREVTFRVREVSRGDVGFIDSLDFHLLTAYSADFSSEESLLKILEEWGKPLEDFRFNSLLAFYARHIEAA